MPIPGKLKGREQEVLDLKRQGVSELHIAIRLGVYPNAIRQLMKRLAKKAASQQTQER